MYYLVDAVLRMEQEKYPVGGGDVATFMAVHTLEGVRSKRILFVSNKVRILCVPAADGQDAGCVDRARTVMQYGRVAP